MFPVSVFVSQNVCIACFKSSWLLFLFSIACFPTFTIHFFPFFIDLSFIKGVWVEQKSTFVCLLLWCVQYISCGSGVFSFPHSRPLWFVLTQDWLCFPRAHSYISHTWLIHICFEVLAGKPGEKKHTQQWWAALHSTPNCLQLFKPCFFHWFFFPKQNLCGE